jgi:hypothetical protein
MTCDCGRPTAGAWLCDRCQQTLAVALCNVAAYYDDLGETVRTKQARYSSGPVSKGSIGKVQPLPVDGRFLDVTGDGTQVRWDVWASVVAWCRVVMEEQPQLAGPVCARPCLHTSCAAIRRRRWPRNTTRSMVAYLDRQFRMIVREQWAQSFLDEMLDNERRLRRLVDRPADRWYAGKCGVTDEDGECNAELYATRDYGTIICPGCGITHDVAERRDVLLSEAAAYLVTATEAAGALLAWTDYDGSESKLVDRIRQWRNRGQLEARSTEQVNGRERHLYRLGDVQALLIVEAQHAQERRITSVG